MLLDPEVIMQYLTLGTAADLKELTRDNDAELALTDCFPSLW